MFKIEKSPKKYTFNHKIINFPKPYMLGMLLILYIRYYAYYAI